MTKKMTAAVRKQVEMLEDLSLFFHIAAERLKEKPNSDTTALMEKVAASGLFPQFEDITHLFPFLTKH